MKATLAEVAAVLGVPAPPNAASLVEGWSVDSRSLQRGDLFFALRGARHDGHDFVSQALARGAAGAVVERPVEGALGPQLVVEDALAALHRAARWARQRFSGPVVAVTGSAGKTTTKEVIAALLSTAMPVGKTEGNLNNHVGLPLTILRLPQHARVAVLELAMNHRGEIRRLAELARPQIGVVTNVGRAHLGFFDSIEQVALAKRELIEALPADGVAVLNADDPRVAAFARVHPGRTVTFGLDPAAQVRADEIEWHPEGSRFRVDGVPFDCPLPGRHGIMNALAGLAVARLFGLQLEPLREALRGLQPGNMRGRRFTHRGLTIFDDCYNANPEAMRAMLELLAATPARRRIAVLGEMLELGHWTEDLHRELGRHVAAAGVDLLLGVRGAAAFMVEEAARSGMPRDAALFFEDPVEAGRFLRNQLREGDAVLFKGSRAVEVEKALAEALGPAEARH